MCLKNGDESGLELRWCMKCKTSAWPKHKKFCSTVDRSGILKLVENLLANPVLNIYLQACFILHFDLLRHPQLDEPFMARVDIGIEPADIPDFMKIFFRQLLEEKIKGMVQVNTFTPITTAEVELGSGSKEVWRLARESTNKMGFKHDSVGLVDMGNSENEQTIACPVHIQRVAMELVRQSRPLKRESAITG
ncbi:hypothetical protein B0H10DRAFT_2226843 [Mycena sp. CBHHK59/15]|nr:hypothetical protein B0H10DRAFT_2226843 [Mycena sp. CBHHK59/15]